MSEGADAFLVDISEAIADPTERAQLIAWGASYLRGGDEDSLIRAGALALELRDHVYRRARSQGQRPSFWQVRLYATALLTACIRARSETTGEGHVKH